jgi:hypothetical protein
MKTTQFAIGGIVILLVAAGFLMLDSANDKKIAQIQDRADKQNQRLEELIKQNKQPAPAPAAVEAPVAPVPTDAKVVATKPKDAPAQPKGTNPTTAGTVAAQPSEVALPNPTLDLKLAAEEKKILDSQISQLESTAGNATANEYNPLQVKIKNLPAVAKIKNYNEKLGFVELDAGKNRQLEKGMVFHVRRDAVLVAQITIGETVEDNVSIADVDPKSIPVGVVLKQGDEVVLYN